jgi:hypothetical protein
MLGPAWFIPTLFTHFFKLLKCASMSNLTTQISPFLLMLLQQDVTLFRNAAIKRMPVLTEWAYL